MTLILCDKADRDSFNIRPASYTLPSETVDTLREVAARILNEYLSVRIFLSIFNIVQALTKYKDLQGTLNTNLL